MMIQTLEIQHQSIISIVGGGGKTSLLHQFAKEYRALHRRTLGTTSTKMFYPPQDVYDHVVFGMDLLLNSENKDNIVFSGSSYDEKKDKVFGYNSKELDQIWESGLFEVMLIESDGARRKPVKAPAIYEPVIYSNTQVYIGVIGLDALGMSVSQGHRPELLQEIVQQEIIDWQGILRLCIHPQGLFKGATSSMKKILILNKMDLLEEKSLERGKKIISSSLPKEVKGYMASVYQEKVIPLKEDRSGLRKGESL